MSGRTMEPRRSDEADPGDVAAGWFAARSASLQWIVLVALSGALVAVMEWAGIPATLLMGPMAAGIILGTNAATIRATGLGFIGGQAVIGCLIANAIEPQVIGTFLASWQLFLPPVLAVLAASSFLG
ncbi:MAG: AbrB family transcriptional regulator, partial [Arenicellales bacterium]